MKKVITCILSMMLICINVSSASATTNDVIKVSLENIEDIMIDNSPDMKIADNNLKKAKDEYDDFKDNYNSKLDEKEDNVEEKKHELEDFDNKKESTNNGQTSSTSANTNLETENMITGNSNKISKRDIKKQLNDLKKDVRDFKNRKKTEKYNFEVAKLQYDKIVKEKVMLAQKQYIEYLNTLSKKQSEQDKVNSKKKDAEIYKNKYDMGFISKKELNSNVTDNVDLDNNLEELNKQEELELKNLHNALGISQNQKIIFVNDINLDIDKISKINFQDDLKEMFENNVDIKIKDIESDEADVSSKDYIVDNAEILLKQEQDNAKLKFEKQYNALITSCNTIKSKNGKLNDKQYDLGTMQTKYNYGFVSKRQVEDSKLEKDKQSAEFLADKNTLYVNYLEYIQMKEGY